MGYRVQARRVRTSELAARAAVNPQTLRYYERRGLLAPRTAPRAATARIRRTRCGGSASSSGPRNSGSP
ncbi:MAG TPA: MerR family DNA-binding transcriptional regulator [Mycobacteriales bacterium]